MTDGEFRPCPPASDCDRLRALSAEPLHAMIVLRILQWHVILRRYYFYRRRAYRKEDRFRNDVRLPYHRFPGFHPNIVAFAPLLPPPDALLDG